MKITFKPKIKTLGFYRPDKVYSFEELRDELMFFSCSIDFVKQNAREDSITRGILDDVIAKLVNSRSIDPLSENNFVIDTRVNMLMPNQYPSIPGWHCDDVPRSEKYSQPDFSKCSEDVQHFLVLLSDSKDPQNCVSGTEFITNTRQYDIDPDRVWGSLNDEAEKDLDKDTRFVREREIVRFDQKAIHRASPASSNGWRLFFRLSYTHRKPVDSIRNQVQVYVDPNNAGW